MGKQIGPYHLLELIGRGGMGEVWRATDNRNGREVAMKLLSSAALADPELAERFRRECRIAGRIHYPHILPVYDFSEGDPSYIVMPYVRGTDLATVLKNNGTLPLERTVNIIEQIASALDVARDNELRHRDVKPSNIMLERGARTDHAWLFDWGIAQPIDPSGAPPVTRVGQLVGTPAYIAPERLKSTETPDHRADVYSLAVVLYECVAGYKPFQGGDMTILTAQLNEAPRPLPGWVPDALREVVLKGLAKDTGKRYQSAGDLARAARAAIDSLPEHPTGKLVPGGGPGRNTVVPASGPRRSWSGAGIAGGAGAGLVAGGALWIFDLIDASMLWIAPALAVAGAAVAAGMSGPRERPPDPNAPPKPGDATRL